MCLAVRREKFLAAGSQPVIGSLKALGKNRPSMWQDLARGARTEIDAINGAIYEEGQRLGIPAPHNKAITHFIHSRERQKIDRKQEIAATLERSHSAVAGLLKRGLQQLRAQLQDWNDR